MTTKMQGQNNLEPGRDMDVVDAAVGTPVSDSKNTSGEFRSIEDFSKDYGKAVSASEKLQEKAREEKGLTKEAQKEAAEKLAGQQAISRVLGYPVHPDTPIKLTPEVVTPSLNDEEAKAKALNVPVGTV